MSVSLKTLKDRKDYNVFGGRFGSTYSKSPVLVYVDYKGEHWGVEFPHWIDHVAVFEVKNARSKYPVILIYVDKGDGGFAEIVVSGMSVSLEQINLSEADAEEVLGQGWPEKSAMRNAKLMYQLIEASRPLRR